MKRFTSLLVLLLTALLLTACGSQESVIAYADIPDTGDAARGREIYYETSRPTCASCHIEEAAGAPHIEEADYPEIAANRVEGQSAREYTFWAIVEPAQHIAEGYGNAMPHRYDNNLSPQQIADLIAYLLQQ